MPQSYHPDPRQPQKQNIPNPRQRWKIYCEAHEKMEFKTQLHNTMFTPAHKNFPSTKRDKKLVMREQNEHL